MESHGVRALSFLFICWPFFYWRCMTLVNQRLLPTFISEPAGLEAHVGNTPLIPLRRLILDLPPSVGVFAKAEWFNPGGSVKDRPALNIIRTAIANGDLRPGKRLLDSTSGNMGIPMPPLARPWASRSR
jgi:threonine synthase